MVSHDSNNWNSVWLSSHHRNVSHQGMKNPQMYPISKDCTMPLYEDPVLTPVSLYQWELSVSPNPASSSNSTTNISSTNNWCSESGFSISLYATFISNHTSRRAILWWQDCCKCLVVRFPGIDQIITTLCNNKQAWKWPTNAAQRSLGYVACQTADSLSLDISDRDTFLHGSQFDVASISLPAANAGNTPVHSLLDNKWFFHLGCVHA